jgi:hypothetical protein
VRPRAWLPPTAGVKIMRAQEGQVKDSIEATPSGRII